MLVLFASFIYALERQQQALREAQRAERMQTFMHQLFRLANSNYTGKPAATVPEFLQLGVKTLPEVLDESLDEPRLKSGVVTVFAVAAMLLASVGLYSLMALVVAARTREIGVRMTLGAQPTQIVGQLLAGVGRLVAIGAAAGLALTWLTGRVLRALLYGVSPMDSLTIGAAILALAVVAAVAAFVPARRAARVDPLAAIRGE